ncbi:BRO-N domain-containing protein [Metapseudomonas otitidis]|uniref:BRO-N domain-containing protein n=1 Tax=Metapseudomonas otitidis TaxID=319939 RepID=UPI0013F65B84|nr:BRO family protein [Pseudomonas otitidis]
MRFEKRNFMGVELDVLVGHPEHELLFVATQVARAAGLKNPSHAVCAFHNQKRGAKLQMSTLVSLSLSDRDKRKVPSNTWLFDEPRVYAMLLKGSAPASEPFRKWVTEEVLPSIRKTGKYNAEESSNPIAVAIMDELKSLRGEIAELRQELQAKIFALAAPAVEPSPYEGQPGVALCDPAGFNSRLYRELGEEIIPRPAVDRLESRVVLHIEVELGKKWDAEDGRKLKDHVSRERRKWRVYPKDWLVANLTRQLYISALQAVIAEKLSA